MSWARIKATGRGKIDLRLRIEGYPVDFVTNSSMITATRVHGLLMDGIAWGESVDPVGGTISGEGFTVTIADVTRRGLPTQYLSEVNPLRTFLSANVATSDTTINVLSTSGFGSTGEIHINTERITYTGKTSTSFTGCTRGTNSSIAQAHYFQPSGAAEFWTPVATHPTKTEGRYCYLYAYGEGDSKTGDGTQVFIGIVNSDPAYRDGKWELGIDTISSILDFEIGTQALAPGQIRGIFYPRTFPCSIEVVQWNAGRNEWTTRGVASVSGFAETTEQLAIALQAQFLQGAAFGHSPRLPAILGTDAKFYAVVPEPGVIEFRLYTGSVADTPLFFLNIPARNRAGEHARACPGSLETCDTAPGARAWYNYDSGEPRVAVTDSYALGFTTTLGVAYFNAGQVLCWRYYAPFPRAYLGQWYAGGREPSDSEIISESRRMYYAGVVNPEVGGSFQFEKRSDEEDSDEVGQTIEYRTFTIDALDNTNSSTGGYVTYTQSDWSVARLALTAANTIKWTGTGVSDGSIRDWLTAISTAAPSSANLGTVPMIRLTTHMQLGPLLNSRDVTHRTWGGIWESTKISDMLKHEMLTMGMIWSVDTSGRLTWRRLALSSRAGLADLTTIDASNISNVTYERAPFGKVSRLVYKYGPKDSRAEYNVRNVTSAAENRNGRTVEIDRQNSSGQDPDISPERAVGIAKFWSGWFGKSYTLLTVTCPLSKMDVSIGDSVEVTSTMIPGSGSMGIEDRIGVVLGKSIDLESGNVTLSVYLSNRESPGISPSFIVSGQSNTSGNIWVITVNLSDEGTNTPANCYESGDKVVVHRRNHTSTAEVAGTVTATSSTTITVEFDTTWTPSSHSWVLKPDVATVVPLDSNLSNRYCYVCDATGFVSFNGGDQEGDEIDP